MRLSHRLNEPTVGNFSLSRHTPEYSDLEIGKLIRVSYRGRFVSGFFVENLSDDEIGNEEIKVSGRGGLFVLSEAVVWYAVSGETKREFSSQPVAEMLITLIDEAQARGCFPGLTYSFTVTEDTDGNAWTDSRTLNMRVGTSLLDVMRNMAGYGIDFEIDLEWETQQCTLHAYQSGQGSDKSSSIVFRPGKNCKRINQTQAGEKIKNAYLLEYKGGSFTTVEDAGSISSYRRRETALSVGQATDDTEAQDIGNNELDDTKEPEYRISIQVDDNVRPRVYVDYELGDWVSFVGRDGTATDYRIVGMDLSWGENDRYATVSLKLNSLQRELEIRTAQAVNKLGGGLPSSRAEPSNDITDAILDISASDIEIVDAGGYYTATEVEGALQEIASTPTTSDSENLAFSWMGF